MNLVQVQEHLKGMPTQVVMAYANGQNPQVPPYVALGELNRRKQLEQPQAQAPQGSVKEQIEQSLMQPQQLPGIAGPGVPVQQPPQPQGMPTQMPQRMAMAPQQQPPAQNPKPPPRRKQVQRPQQPEQQPWRVVPAQLPPPPSWPVPIGATTARFRWTGPTGKRWGAVT